MGLALTTYIHFVLDTLEELVRLFHGEVDVVELFTVLLEEPDHEHLVGLFFEFRVPQVEFNRVLVFHSPFVIVFHEEGGGGILFVGGLAVERAFFPGDTLNLVTENLGGRVDEEPAFINLEEIGAEELDSLDKLTYIHGVTIILVEVLDLDVDIIIHGVVVGDVGVVQYIIGDGGRYDIVSTTIDSLEYRLKQGINDRDSFRSNPGSWWCG
jgi:hypothetical protein